MRRTVIIGTGSYIPNKRVGNDEFLNNRFFMDYGQPIDTACLANLLANCHKEEPLPESVPEPDTEGLRAKVQQQALLRKCCQLVM